MHLDLVLPCSVFLFLWHLVQVTGHMCKVRWGCSSKARAPFAWPDRRGGNASCRKFDEGQGSPCSRSEWLGWLGIEARAASPQDADPQDADPQDADGRQD